MYSLPACMTAFANMVPPPPARVFTAAMWHRTPYLGPFVCEHPNGRCHVGVDLPRGPPGVPLVVGDVVLQVRVVFFRKNKNTIFRTENEEKEMEHVSGAAGGARESPTCVPDAASRRHRVCSRGVTFSQHAVMLWYNSVFLFRGIASRTTREEERSVCVPWRCHKAARKHEYPYTPTGRDAKDK